MGVLHLQTGNVLAVRGRELFVDEACSGVISVMSVIACAAILAVWRKRALLHMLLLILGGVLCAMLMNVVRISAIAAVLYWFNWDWTKGWQHELLSLGSFLVTFGVLLATDLMLVGVTAEVTVDEADQLPRGSAFLAKGWNAVAAYQPFPQPDFDDAPPVSVTGNSSAIMRRPPWLRFAMLALVAVALGVFHSVALYAHFVSATSDPDHIVERILQLEPDGLDQAIGAWRITSSETVERDTLAELGRFSKLYTVEHPTTGRSATLSIDFPFYRRWHDLCGCYLNSGWEQLTKEVVRAHGAADKRPDQEYQDYIVADFVNEEGVHGRLLFSNMNDDGRPVSPPAEIGDFGYLINMFIDKVNHRRQISLNPRKIFQVQVWTAGTRSADMPQEVVQLFFDAQNYLSRELAAAAQPL
jgi:exosortase/archaeosortase family protein